MPPVIGVPITSSSRLRPSGTHLVELERVEEVGQLAGLLLLLQFDVELKQSVERQLRLVVDVDLERVLAELDKGEKAGWKAEERTQRAKESVSTWHPGSDKRQRRPVDPTAYKGVLYPTRGAVIPRWPAGVERSKSVPFAPPHTR
jgi:hypothetical protein